MGSWAYIALCLIAASAAVPETPEVIVVTVATEKTDGLKRLLKSAAAFDINLRVFGLGEKWNGGDTRTEQGGGQKINILKKELEPYKDSANTMILFVDAYDVVFTAPIETILMRYFQNYPDERIIFGAEPFCWPDQKLAPKFPLVSFGKRFLNSGLYLGYAPDVYKMLSLKPVADADDDQLYFSLLYTDDKIRKDLKMGLDSISRIFQNLNGVEDDVELEFDPDDGTASAHNAAYNTHPCIVHGNGPSKRHLNYLANYIGHQWNSKSGCADCGDRSHFSFNDIKEIDDHPHVTIAVFIHRPIPFVEEFFNKVLSLDYPMSRISLFVFNSQPFNIDFVYKFAEKHATTFYTKRFINGVLEVNEREARQRAIDFHKTANSDFVFFLDADAHLTNARTLKFLIEDAINHDFGFVAPMMTHPGKVFSNFWGALGADGFYARSEDYMAIVKGNRVGYWNVPFISSAILATKKKLASLQKPFESKQNWDPDMAFCDSIRKEGHFMYVTNEIKAGFLAPAEEFAENVAKGFLHPEMWQLFENRELWEERYLHPKYKETLEAEDVHQVCPDVYDYPLMSERFCEEMISEMEHFGKWSDGSHSDERLAGGYENVPTRDIHMNQIGFERQWLYFLNEYVRPMQEKTFVGYFQNPIHSNMMFVVRYRPDEQPSLRPHHDASTYSIDVALNRKGVDYEGGGVRYVRYNCTVPADEVGYTMMFPGRLTHLHEGLPTTAGTRYILVSFINP